MTRTAAFSLGAAALIWASPARALLADYQTAVTNETGIISYYTFEQDNAVDVRGPNHGTLMGTTAFASGVGGGGRALSLDGTGRVNLGVVPDFAFDDTTGSIEAWVQAGNLGGLNCTLFATRDNATRYSIHLNANKSGIGFWNGGAYQVISIPNASTTWHHVVVVFDSDNYTVYWDGNFAGTAWRNLGTAPGVATQLGSASPSYNGEGWVGKLDEVAFYANALSAEAVQAHYLAFFAGNPPVITQHPQGGTYLPGVTRTLTVKATGPNLVYQWYRGSTPLAGKTDTTLILSSLSAGDAGAYSVIVTNTAGVAPSDPVTIALASSLPTPLIRYQTAISNETSLISYYTFDRLLPNDAFDSHDGTLVGTADWAAGVGGGPGQGLMLDGAGHVQLGAVSDFDFASGTGTVEGWIRADWTSRSDYPCMFANRDGSTRWSLHLSGDKKYLTFWNGINSLGYAVPAGGAGTAWHHVAMVFDAGTATYYWDGALVSTQTQSISDNYVTVQLGSSAATSTAEGWAGMLDEVAFYSAALPDTSIQAHYNAYFVGDPPVITGQPVGGVFLADQPFQMSVAASGAQLEYQWYQNDVAVPFATNATISTSSLTLAHAGWWYARVFNASGSTNSATALVQVGNNISRYQATVLGEPSLLSYYTFDAGDAQDAKNAHPGMVANIVSFAAGAGGVTNQSLTLDGTGHIDLGQVADFEFTSGSGTVECWVRPDWTAPAAYDPTLFADRDGASVWSIHMGRWKNEIGNWNSDRFQAQPISGANGWHHYAVAFGAGKVTMYWDGQPIGTSGQAINLNSGKTTQIGSSAPAATAEGWLGGLDEVAFYAATLDDATISNHFLAMVGPESAPDLSFALVGKQLTLSWPASAIGFTLEQADSLPAISWTAVGGVVNNQVTVDASSGMRYYRLKK